MPRTRRPANEWFEGVQATSVVGIRLLEPTVVARDRVPLSLCKLFGVELCTFIGVSSGTKPRRAFSLTGGEPALPNPFRRPVGIVRTVARIDRGTHRRVPLGVELVAVYFLRTLLGLSDCVGCNVVARLVLRTSIQAPG